jgi:hypothetical protein
MSLFRQGLSPMLREHLTLFWGCTLNELVSASIEQEDTCRARLEEERKKRPLPGPNGGAPPKYRLVYTSPSGQPHGFTPRAPPPPIGQPKAAVHPPSSRVGRASFTTLQEIPLSEEVLAGTFFLYEHPIIILFDSRASHDFLSLTCAQKADVTLCATQVPYSISTPGGKWMLIRWSVKSHLSLLGKCFTSLLLSWKIKGSMSFLV